MTQERLPYVSPRSFLDGQDVVFEEAVKANSDKGRQEFGRWLQEEWETFEGFMESINRGTNSPDKIFSFHK